MKKKLKFYEIKWKWWWNHNLVYPFNRCKSWTKNKQQQHKFILKWYFRVFIKFRLSFYFSLLAFNMEEGRHKMCHHDRRSTKWKWMMAFICYSVGVAHKDNFYTVILFCDEKGNIFSRLKCFGHMFNNWRWKIWGKRQQEKAVLRGKKRFISLCFYDYSSFLYSDSFIWWNVVISRCVVKMSEIDRKTFPRRSFIRLKLPQVTTRGWKKMLKLYSNLYQN